MEYAQARIQSRFGERPAQAAWQRLDGVRELASFLEAANRTGLQRWIAGLDERAAWHRIEIALRERLRAAIRETARWMPERWQQAMLWTLHLVDLPALARLARGEAALSWMNEDPVMHYYLSGERSRRPAGTLGEAERSQLFSPPREHRSNREPSEFGAVNALLAAWLRLWKTTWPRNAGEELEAVTQVARQFASQLAIFESCSSPDRAVALRGAWEVELRRLFRRSTLLPAAAFAYIVLVALDLERLRAMLAERVLLAQMEDSL